VLLHNNFVSFRQRVTELTLMFLQFKRESHMLSTLYWSTFVPWRCRKMLWIINVNRVFFQGNSASLAAENIYGTKFSRILKFERETFNKIQERAYYGYLVDICRGTRWRNCLRHCAIILNFAVSVPGYLIGIFQGHNPYDRTLALASTQPPTEVNTRNIFWRGKGGRCIGPAGHLTTFVNRLSWNVGPSTSRKSQRLYRDSFTFQLTYIIWYNFYARRA
jgi:hypothetical protein